MTTSTLSAPAGAAQMAEKQLAAHARKAQEFCDKFREYNEANSDWNYYPPIDDDPETWKGVTKWCALEVSYVYHCEREAALRAGGKPMFCPRHEDKPGEGFRPAPCFRCAWDAELYDRAIGNARSMGRQWAENVRAGREAAFAAVRA